MPYREEWILFVTDRPILYFDHDRNPSTPEVNVFYDIPGTAVLWVIRHNKSGELTIFKPIPLTIVTTEGRITSPLLCNIYAYNDKTIYISGSMTSLEPIETKRTLLGNFDKYEYQSYVLGLLDTTSLGQSNAKVVFTRLNQVLPYPSFMLNSIMATSDDKYVYVSGIVEPGYSGNGRPVIILTEKLNNSIFLVKQTFALIDKDSSTFIGRLSLNRNNDLVFISSCQMVPSENFDPRLYKLSPALHISGSPFRSTLSRYDIPDHIRNNYHYRVDLRQSILSYYKPLIEQNCSGEYIYLQGRVRGSPLLIKIPSNLEGSFLEFFDEQSDLFQLEQACDPNSFGIMVFTGLTIQRIIRFDMGRMSIIGSESTAPFHTQSIFFRERK